ncbi:hypothetical protein VNI00_004780 [Paramarasmius palmivorus]|uniref:Uncharacterized protein n=1 Tax=Paramarasmius palmivorus TaxID=297713 RepID=A0AAW0DLJ8_9AGAR
MASGPQCSSCGVIFKKMNAERSLCFRCEKYDKATDAAAREQILAEPQCTDCGLVFALMKTEICAKCASERSPRKPGSPVKSHSGVAPPVGPTQKQAKLKLAAPSTSPKTINLVSSDDEPEVILAGANAASSSASQLQERIDERKLQVADLKVLNKEDIPSKTKKFIAQREANSTLTPNSMITLRAKVFFQHPTGSKTEAAALGGHVRQFSPNDTLQFAFAKLVSLVNEDPTWQKQYGTVIPDNEVRWRFAKENTQIEARFLRPGVTIAQFWSKHKFPQYAQKKSDMITNSPEFDSDDAEPVIVPTSPVRTVCHRQPSNQRKCKVIKDESDEEKVASRVARKRVKVKEEPHELGSPFTLRLPPSTSSDSTRSITIRRSITIQRMTINPDGELEAKGVMSAAKCHITTLHRDLLRGQATFLMEIGGAEYHAVSFEFSSDAERFSFKNALEVAKLQLIRDQELGKVVQALTEKAKEAAVELPPIAVAPSFVVTTSPHASPADVYICYDAPPQEGQYKYISGCSDFDEPNFLSTVGENLRETILHFSFLNSKKTSCIIDVKTWHVDRTINIALPTIFSVSGNSGFGDKGPQALTDLVKGHCCIGSTCEDLKLEFTL